MAAGDIIMVDVYFDMVLKTPHDEEYQLTCVAVKEGEANMSYSEFSTC